MCNSVYRCINALSGMNGQQLLRSKMKDLDRLVGHDEAQRLAGHLTLLKNKTGVCNHLYTPQFSEQQYEILSISLSKNQASV